MSILFTYGALMADRVWSRVLGCAPHTHRRVHARLRGYQRYAVMGETYPGMIVAPGELIEGEAYFGLTAGQVELLDRFMGADYRRIIVSIEIESLMVNCETYQYLFPDCLETTPWSTDLFDENHFMQRYEGFAAKRLVDINAAVNAGD
jgi:gamma-glutamylcyclotransferase (GGCT)/AIG2-like uncharacterized protein YtfP